MALDITSNFRILAGVDGQAQIDRFNRSLKEGEHATRALNSGALMLRNALGTVGLGTAAVQMFRQMFTAAREAEEAELRINAVLKATGYTAGLTRDQLDEMNDELFRTTQFDDEAIRNAQSQFLKFGNIQEDVFKKGIELSADLAAFMGSDLSAAAQIVGKALASPAEGAGTLERQIGKLSQATKDYIDELVEQGRLQDAQNVILGELEKKIGGVAEEMNTGLTKATTDLGKAWDDLNEALGRTSAFQGATGGVLKWLTGEMTNLRQVVEGGDWLERLRYFSGYGFLDNLIRFGVGAPLVPVVRDKTGTTQSVTGKITQGGKPLEQVQAEAAAEAARKEFAEEQKLAALKEEQEKRAKAAEAALKSLTTQRETFLKSLQDEATQLVTNEEDWLRYRAAQLGVADAAEPLIQNLRLAREQNDAQKEAEEITKRAIDKLDDYNEHLEKQSEHWKDVADPLREYKRELAELEELYARGMISAQEFDKAQDQVSKDMAEAMKRARGEGKTAMEELEDAVQGWGRSATDAFIDFAFGAKTSFKDMITEMLKDLARMVLYLNVVKPLFDAFSGWLGGVFSGGGGGGGGGSLVAHTGGIIGSDALPVRKFHTGGIAGDEIPAILRRGEGVFTDAQMRKLAPAGSGGVQVNVTVNADTGKTDVATNDNNRGMRDLGLRMAAAARQVIIDERRPGGLLYGNA